MRKKERSILGIDSLGTCCSLSNLVMLAALWDRLHLAYGFLRQKKTGKPCHYYSAALLPLEKGAQLGDH